MSNKFIFILFYSKTDSTKEFLIYSIVRDDFLYKIKISNKVPNK